MVTTNWKNEIKTAKTAAKAAGKALLDASLKSVISNKGRDIKLKADLEAEAVILNIIEKESSYPILSEESNRHKAFFQENSYLWVIDPLDGTLNYSKGIGFCCVSIALWKDGLPLLGVIYDFNNDDLFSGVINKGAWCNDKPIHPSYDISPDKAVLVTGFPINRDFSNKALADFIKNIKSFKKIRLLGSAALSLAYVACGKADGYVEEDIMLWDVAAGIAIVKAAGGNVFCQDSSRTPFARNIMAGNVFRKVNHYDSL
jgi:myo-inositol-1(or 4)-monophosphatase